MRRDSERWGRASSLTGESMSSSRSTEQRSHCSRVNARCMIFLTIFSRSVCSSNRSLTTSSRAYMTTTKHYRNVCYIILFSCYLQGFLPDFFHTLCETLKTTWHWILIFHRKGDTSAAPEQKSKKNNKINSDRYGGHRKVEWKCVRRGRTLWWSFKQMMKREKNLSDLHV